MEQRMIGSADCMLLLQATFGLSPNQALDVMGRVDGAWKSRDGWKRWEEAVELLLRSVYEATIDTAESRSLAS